MKSRKRHDFDSEKEQSMGESDQKSLEKTDENELRSRSATRRN